VIVYTSNSNSDGPPRTSRWGDARTRHHATARGVVRDGVMAGALAGALVLAATAAWGQASRGLAQDGPPPIDTAPRDVTGGDLVGSMRSDVRIVTRDNHEIEEHRVGDNVYAIKVKPKNAPPYYLYDNDGSGNFQWRRGMDLERTSVPHWAVVRW